MERLLLTLGLVAGLLLAYVDSRPTWDDTGVIAGALLIVTTALGVLVPRRPWLTALGVGIWIPLVRIGAHANYGSLIALVLAFVGAYAGMLLRRVFVPG